MYDKVIGALLVASWVNAALFTVEAIQVISYYKTYRNDPKTLKALVGTCFGFDIISTVVNDIGVYRYTVSYWGNLEFMNHQQWQIPLYLYATALGAALVQIFLMRRYYLLSKRWAPLVPISVLVLVSLAGAFACATMLTYATSLSQRAMVRIPVIVWFAGSCIVDCALAGLLIFELRASRATYKTTRGLVNRLSSVALQSGAYTSLVALIVLSLYLIDPGANIATGFCQCLGRIYTLTLLHNLLIRQTVRAESKSGTNTSGCITSGGIETFALGGIRIQRDQVIVSENSKAVPLSGEPSVKRDDDEDRKSKDSEVYCIA